MGHSVLSRQHVNDTLMNGDYKTMMFGGNQFDLYNNFTQERRDYYLDELFDPNTPPPSWSTVKSTPSVVVTDSIALSNAWTFYSGAASHTGTISGEVYASSSHSLVLTSSGASTGYSYWQYVMNAPALPVGSRLAYKVKLRLVNVTGNGIFVSMRGDAGAVTDFFATSASITKITGTRDFAEYTAIQKYVPGGLTSITFYVIMDGSSTGMAFIDDVRIISYH